MIERRGAGLRRLLIGFAAAATIACGLGASAAAQQTRAPACVEFNGLWSYEGSLGAGYMALSSAGSKVSGVYKEGDGRLQGTVSGNTLKGRYAQDGGKRYGSFEITLSEDGGHFSGTHRGIIERQSESVQTSGGLSGRCTDWRPEEGIRSLFKETDWDWSGPGSPLNKARPAEAAPPSPTDAADRASETSPREEAGPRLTGGCRGFAGQWMTNYGPMVLRQEGSVFTGEYGAAEKPGTLRGVVEGAFLRGRWEEGPGSSGEFGFELVAAENRFAGGWVRDQGDAGSWSGECIGE